WSKDTVALIRAGKWHAIDPQALIEEVESVGASQYAAVSSAVYQILTHLLKWRYQPERRSRSWQVSLDEHRRRIPRRLRRMPPLAQDTPEMIAEESPGARKRASLQTGLPLPTFPAVCPWTPAQVRDEDFWPEPPAPAPSQTRMQGRRRYAV